MQARNFKSTQNIVREFVVAYLEGHTVFNLATYGPAGLWSSAVLYINEGTQLYFTSEAATRHSHNLHATGRVAGTVSDECREFAQMKGIQLEGKVEFVTSVDDRRRVLRAYLARFPFSAGLWHGVSDPDVIALDPGPHGFYRIKPTRLLFTDNEHFPGHRQELMEL